MKYVKMLGLAAVAAMALMAFIGASSASATVLCKTAASPCPEGWDYSSGITLSLSIEEGTSTTLRNTSGVIENTCTSSTLKGTTSNTGSPSETVKGTVTAANLTYSGCSTTTDVLEGGELEVHRLEGTSNGTVTARGVKVTTNLAGVSCTYGFGAGTDLGTLTGGTMATLDVHAIVNKQAGSFLCPGDVVWDMSYTVTEPEPLYVSAS